LISVPHRRIYHGGRRQDGGCVIACVRKCLMVLSAVQEKQTQNSKTNITMKSQNHLKLEDELTMLWP